MTVTMTTTCNPILQRLIAGLVENDPSLVSLSLSSLPLFEIAPKEMEEVLWALASNQTVTFLEFWLPDCETYDFLQPIATSCIESIVVSSVETTQGWMALLQAVPSVKTLQLGTPKATTTNRDALNDNACLALSTLLQQSNLQSLSLKAFQMSQQGARSLVDGLQRSTTLGSIELVQMQLDDILLQGLVSSTSVQSLTIVGCRLVLSRLGLSDALRSLELVDCQLESDDDDAGTCVAACTLSMSQLESLKIRYCQNVSYNALRNILQNHSLKELIVEDSVLQQEHVDAICSVAIDSLTHLSIRGNSMNLESGNILTNLLCRHVNLQSLDLSENSISNNAMKELCQALAASNVQELYLEQAQLDSVTFQTLFHSVTDSSLSLLDLSGNRIDEPAAVSALAEMLGAHTSRLTSLYLNSCAIDNAGVATLAKQLHLSKLENLSLAGNDIGNDGIMMLSVSLSDANSSLLHLDLTCNRFNKTGLSCLAKAVKENLSLRRIDLTNADSDWMKELDVLLSLNRAGRKEIRQGNYKEALWPLILARVDQCGGADALFSVLRNEAAPSLVT